MDAGYDEVDYGEEEELGERDGGGSPSFEPAGSVLALAEDEMLQDEDYEDLYDDVNIGYFEAPVELSTKQGADVFAGYYAEEEDYDTMVDGVYADEQPIVDTVTKFGKSEPTNALKSPLSENQGNVDEDRGLPILQPKEDSKNDIVKDQIGGTTPAHGSASGKNFGQEVQPENMLDAVATSSAVRTNEVEDLREAGSQVGWATKPAIDSTQTKEQDEHLSNGPDTKSSAQLSEEPYSGSEKGGRGSGAVPSVEKGTMATTRNMNGTGMPPPSSGAKTTGSAKGKVGGAGMVVDGVKATAGMSTGYSQGGANRDFSSNAVNPTRHRGQASDSGGGTMLFVGELQWWTTDAELEAALSEYGRIKNVKFFEERASGKSKGYCQVEFFDHAAAAACKEGLNGRVFNGRPCLVAFASPAVVQQMGYAQVNKAQAQLQAQQAQSQPRRMQNDAVGRGTSYQGGDGGRNYGRMRPGGRVSHGYSVTNRGQGGPGRGRGTFGIKGMGSSGSNSVGVGGAPYGQGMPVSMGGHPSSMMIPQGMIGQGYDPSYGPSMARGGAGYGGYAMHGPPFATMVPPFPGVLPGVAPHVNPAFFGRSTTANGMGMMPTGGMDVPHSGIWGDASMSGWGSEEHDKRAREASYGEDIGGSDFGYGGDMGHEKGRASGARDRDRGTDGDWVEQRRRDDRDVDLERERHRGRDRDGYRDQREREWNREDDWERERPIRRSKARMEADGEDEEQHPRSREEEHGKRRRMAAER
eukprot:c24381_g1_i1 orf=55-2307(+)